MGFVEKQINHEEKVSIQQILTKQNNNNNDNLGLENITLLNCDIKNSKNENIENALEKLKQIYHDQGNFKFHYNIINKNKINI